jgi:SpoVK/Ycf46/Vps4 family AAA+-type ATPase
MIAQEVGKSANKKELEISEDLIRALSGLSTSEAENALSLSVVETGKFSPEVVYREKISAVKRSGLLEIVTPDPLGLDSIGGLDNLKAWILKRKKAYSNEAESFGLPAPKGILLVGIPGSGKSLSAKAFGTALGIPTLKLDIGSLFSSLVGDSEAKTKATLELAEAMAPCVLWADEIDKGLSGAQGSGNNDSGVTRRVFGAILEWMQNRKKPVFVVATANQVESLPPEFLRKGRFDEIFALDLPTAEEREQIIKVQLKKYRRDYKKFSLQPIVEATNSFSGAEIEGVIVEALYDAFDSGEKELTTEYVVKASESIIPLSKVMAEKIEAIRQWAEGRARSASVQQKREQPSNKRRLKMNNEDNEDNEG